MYAHARTPVRIGIAGGGTDLPAWTKERVGHCLSLAIDRYAHAVVIDRPDGQVIASYSKLDHATAATELGNGLVRETALMHGWNTGFEVHTISQVSSQGSGLGVSSSIAVALAAAFATMTRLERKEAIEPKWRDGGEEVFRLAVAKDAWTVEIEKLLRPIGRQDHMAAAHGGLRLYRFEGDEAEVERSFSANDAAWLAERLMLIQLPDGHDSRAILSAVQRTEQIEAALASVALAVQGVVERDLGLIGEALNLGHESKTNIPGAVPERVAEVVHKLLFVDGVRGIKVCGAGGGGHLVVAAEPETIAEVRSWMDLPTSVVRSDLVGVRSEGWL